MRTLSTPPPDAVRRFKGKSKLGDPIKAGLCNALKWHIKQGTNRGSFYLKVPVTPATQELTVWLRKQRAEAATYFAPGGTIVARQWRLTLADYRDIWRKCPNEIDTSKDAD